MLTETWKGWAIASTRKDGTEKILMFDAFLSLHPDQAEVILRKLRRECPDKSYRIVPVTVEVREESDDDLRALQQKAVG